MHDGSFTKSTGSADAGDLAGSQTCRSIAATTPLNVSNDPARCSGFVADSAGCRTSLRLSDIRTALDLGRVRRAVRVGDRARLDRRARKPPVGRLPRHIVYSAALGASLVVVFISLVTFSTSPVNESLLRVPPRINEILRASPWIMGLACAIGSTLAKEILVLFFSWVFRNSLAIRPTVAGALYGAGAGLAINAGWRIACPVATPWHALGAHGAAIIATVILGGLIGRFLGNRRLYISGRRS